MLNLSKLKATFILLFLGIVIVACQNSPKTATQEESESVAQSVYIVLEVSGMTCGGCESTVESALTAIEGVDSAFASYVDEKVKILVDTTKVSVSFIKETIDSEGYTSGSLIK